MSLISGRGKDFSLLHSVQIGYGPTQPLIQMVLGALPSGIKRLGREIDRSPPSTVEVKNSGAIPSLPDTSS
jgi:hypothetical protein